jgi:hypothetical protein
MPKTSKLSEEERARASQWIDNNFKYNIPNCPFCRDNRWQLFDDFLELRRFHHGDMYFGGDVYPCICLVCVKCGYTALVNAIVSGILEKEPPKENADVE